MRRRSRGAGGIVAGALACGGCFVDMAPMGEGSEAGSSGASEATTTSGASTSAAATSAGTTSAGATSGGTTSAAATSAAATSTSGDDVTTGCTPMPWYLDSDGDGHGDPNVAMEACEAPTGHVAVGDDCDDSRKGVFPGAAEVCNQIDDDCDAFTDEFSPQNVECGGCSMSSIGGHIYHRCAAARAWGEARALCMGRSADLVILEAVSEASVLAQIGVPGSSTWWIGLSDTAEEGTFAWVDGSLLGEANWDDGEPNDAGGAEDCGQIQPNGFWNDAECDAALPFVCEGEIVGE